MKVEVTENIIEGFCDLNGRGSRYSVITLLKNRDEWSVGNSMCLPSSVDDATKIMEVYNKAFEALEEVKKKPRIDESQPG